MQPFPDRRTGGFNSGINTCIFTALQDGLRKRCLLKDFAAGQRYSDGPFKEQAVSQQQIRGLLIGDNLAIQHHGSCWATLHAEAT